MVLFGVLLTCIPRCGRLNSIRVVGAKDVLPNFFHSVLSWGFFFFLCVFFVFVFFFLFCFVFRVPHYSVVVMSRWIIIGFGDTKACCVTLICCSLHRVNICLCS